MGATHKAHTKSDIARRIIFIFTGAIIMAVGLEGILIPNNIIDGGIVGVAIMASHITGVSLGIFLFVLNVPFIYIGYKQIGKTFALMTFFGIIVLSITTKMLHHIKPFFHDPMLAAIFGGLVIGLGIGLVLRNGGSLDGTESLAILANKKFPFSVGENIMIINVLIFIVAGFVFEPTTALYSAVAYFVAFKTIDVVQEGLDESKQVTIITEYHNEIREAIHNRLGHTVTVYQAEGGYSGEIKNVLTCIITRLEERKMKDIVVEIDSNAFMTISEVAEVMGGKFKKRDIH